MKRLFPKYIFLGLCISLMALPGLAQQPAEDCDTYLLEMDDPDNNCAPCANGMEQLLKPVQAYLHARQEMLALNDQLREYFQNTQQEINDLVKLQEEFTDAGWNIKNLAGGPEITDTRYLDNWIRELEGYGELYPKWAEWISNWTTQLKELKTKLDEVKALESGANTLADAIAEGKYGNLSDLEFDCCPSAIEDGRYTPDQLTSLPGLVDDLASVVEDLVDKRTELAAEASKLTELLKSLLSQRNKEEEEAYARRDQYANGFTAFLFEQFSQGLHTGLMTNLYSLGIDLSPEQVRALEKFSEALSNQVNNSVTGGGLTGTIGEASGLLIDKALESLSPNDREIFGMIGRAAVTEAANLALQKSIERMALSGGQKFLAEGAGNAGIPIMLLDRLVTVPAFLWEDKNRMILQGAYDRLTTAVLVGIRLCRGTNRFLPTDPVNAYIDALKGPNNRAIVICMPPQETVPRDAESMANAFLDVVVPGLEPRQLSANDRYEMKTDGDGPNGKYLVYIMDQKMRFHLRYQCFCGVQQENVSETTTGPNIWTTLDPLDPGLKTYTPGKVLPPWDKLDLSGASAKIFFTPPPPVAASKGFPVWIPVAGGVVAGGVVTYLLLKESDDTGIVARDDVLTLDCNGQGTINVLNNDSGDNIGVTQLGSAPNATIIHQGGGIIAVSATGTSNFNFSYTITDQGGNTATGNVQVNLELSPIEAVDDMYEITDGSPVSGTLLANDTGIGLTLTDHTEPTSGTLGIGNDGSFTYTPEQGFSGTATFSYTITDACGQTATADVTITITLPPCSLTLTTNSTDADCGTANGSASVSVTPSGTYTYLWSTGAGTEGVVDLSAGVYTVTVFDMVNNCEQSTEVTIGELAPDYILTTSTVNASCTSNGEIIITLQSPAGGDLIVDGMGPNGPINFQTPPGVVFLSSFIEIPAGLYSLTIYALNTGEACSEEIDVTIEDLTPELEAVDDGFSILNTTTLTGNLLDNDSGMGISIASFTNPSSGSLILNPDGSFSYTPESDFEGQVTFMYAIQDVCGGTATATVTITINQNACLFDVDIQTESPDCGFENGSIFTFPEPEGNYSYEWSDGSNGMQLNNVGAGTYGLTVTDLDAECENTYSIDLTAKTADYIVSISAFPGTCLGGGNITLELASMGPGPFIAQINGPGLMEQVSLEAGITELESLFDLLPGTYEISVYDESVGPDCTDNATIEIPDGTPPLEAVDDVYTIQTGLTLEGNVLDNDSGLEISVVDFTMPGSGTVTVNADGTFEYNAEPGFEGEVTFSYTIRDACGNLASAIVTIKISNEACSFTVDFTKQLPHCGFDDGSITAQVTPPGTYTYAWSTGATGNMIDEVGEGTYGLTVTDTENNCSEAFSVELLALPPNYISSLSTQPGTCIGNGDIIISLTSIGAGPFAMTIDGPNLSEAFTLEFGVSSLSDMFNIVAGLYTLTVYDISIGSQCTQIVEVVVEDNTPDLVAVNDMFTTPFEVPLNANTLTNDSGLDILMTDAFEAYNGTVDFQFDGDFTFIPNNGFSGEAGFIYTVEDACGSTQNANVTIIVEEEQCVFEPTFNVTPADCGLANGMVMTTVDPPGFYFFQWSTGQTGANLTDVESGEYNVTITDLELGCSLSFPVEVPELPASYISNLVVTQPDCNIPGGISFIVEGPADGPFVVNVQHPNGVDEIVVEEGTVVLGDFIPITPGEYTITVFDQTIGEQCAEIIMVFVTAPPMLVIEVLEIVPPSSMSSNDGAIIGTITQPTTGPYTIYLNGEAIGDVAGPDFEIEGLAVGTYDIQLEDANGCFSNLLVVELTAAGPPVSYGLQSYPGGFSFQSLLSGKEMPAWIDPGSTDLVFAQAGYVEWRPLIGGIQFEGNLTVLSGSIWGPSGRIALQHISAQALRSYEVTASSIRTHVGIGMEVQNLNMADVRSGEALNIMQPSFLGTIKSTLDIGKAILHGSGEIRVSSQVQWGVRVQVRVPFR